MTPHRPFSAVGKSFTPRTDSEPDLSRNAFLGCCTPETPQGKGRHSLDSLGLRTLALKQACLWDPRFTSAGVKAGGIQVRHAVGLPGQRVCLSQEAPGEGDSSEALRLLLGQILPWELRRDTCSPNVPASSHLRAFYRRGQ